MKREQARQIADQYCCLDLINAEAKASLQRPRAVCGSAPAATPAQPNIGKWPHWKQAATADSKLFEALPKPVQDYELEQAEGKGSK